MSIRNLNKDFTVTLIATTLFISTYYLLLPVLPLHMQGMGADKFVIGLIMGLFSASSLVLRPLAGKASDLKGPVKIMKISILIFFATPLCFFIDSFYLIGLAQLTYGLTVGAFTISSAMVITASVENDKLGPAIGIHSIALILAKGLAPTIGTVIYNKMGLFPVIVITVVLALCAFFLTSRLGAFPPQESKTKVPFKNIAANKMVWVPSLALVTVTLTFGNIMTMLPLMAIERQIPSYSWFFTVNTIAVVLIRIATGRQHSLSQEAISAASLVVLFFAVGMVTFANNLSALIGAAFIYGLGYGAVYPALSTLVVLNTPAEVRGTAFGFFTAFFDIGVTLGSVWGGFSEYLGFKMVYGIAACAPLLGLFSFLFFLRKYKIWLRITGKYYVQLNSAKS